MDVGATALRNAVLRADPLLSKYNPLERLLLVSDFNTGQHGWQTLFPDYDGATDYPDRYPPVDPLDAIVAQSRVDGSMRVDRRVPTGPRGVPMLSSLTSWDIGSSGSWHGTYALKIPTIARRGDKGLAVKRLMTPWPGKVRIECYFSYKAEASDFRLGELDVRSIMVALDVMDPHHVRQAGAEPLRWWPSVRYHNAQDRQLIQRWQANLSGSVGVMDGPWHDLDGGHQELAFNRSPTKYQWSYLRFTFDVARHEYVDLHCQGQEIDVAGRQHRMNPPLSGFRASTDKCSGLIAVVLGIEADSDKRCFLFVDSLVVSASES